MKNIRLVLWEKKIFICEGKIFFMIELLFELYDIIELFYSGWVKSKALP